MKKAKRATISPTTAPVIVPRADSSLALSPPDIIQRIPPAIIKNSAATIAKIRRIVTTLPVILLASLSSSLQRGEKPLATVGQRPALTETAENKNSKPVKINGAILFILFIIISTDEGYCQDNP